MDNRQERIVISIGSDANDAGREISRIRGSSHANVANLVGVRSLLESSPYVDVIVVCIYAQMNVRSLIAFQGEICCSFPSVSLGFFCDTDSFSLVNRFWLNRASTQTSANTNEVAQFSFEHSDFRGFVSDADVPTGSSKMWSLDDLKDLALHSWDALYLVGHSNSHDAGLGRLVLCHGQHQSYSELCLEAFPCHYGAKCRFAASDYAVTSASSIRSRIVVALLCWGVVGKQGTFARELTIGHTLLTSTLVRTLITFMRATALERSEALLAYYLLTSGSTAGQVVNRLNRARLHSGKQAEFFCFGDPSSRLDMKSPAIRTLDTSSGAYVEIASYPVISKSDFLELQFSQSVSANDVICTRGMRAMVADHLGLFAIPNFGDQMSVSIKERSSVFVSAQTVARLLKECAFLQRFIRGCSRNSVLLEGNLHVLGCAVEDLVDICEGHRFGANPTAAAVAEEASGHALSVLLGAVNTLQDALSDILCANAGRGGTHFMRVASRYYRTVSEASLETNCPYCGDSLEEEKRKDALNLDERVSLFCNSCGPIFEGGPGDHVALQGSSTMRLGEIGTSRIFVQNQYTIPTRAMLNVHLAGYGLEALAGQANTTILDQSNGQVIIESHLYIPHSIAPGLYYLQASLVVGADVCFYRKPISVLLDGSDVSESRLRAEEGGKPF